MKHWSIGRRVMFLALAPSILIVAALVTYFTFARVLDMDRALEQRALAIGRQLAPASEFGLFAGDVANLQRLTDAAQREPDVSAITIRDAYGVLVAHSAASAERASAGARAPLVYVVPVYQSELRFADVAEPGTEVGRQKQIGEIAIEMSQAATRQEQRRQWLVGLLLGLGGMVFALLLAFAMSRSAIRSIRLLARATAEVGRGEVDVRVPVRGGGELRALAEGFNWMAARIASARHDLQGQVKDATQDLQRQKEEAEQANIAKTRFLAAASHDLRQPLHTIGLLVGILRERADAAELRQLADKIQVSVGAMENLFVGLLDISKLDAGTIKPNITEFCLEELFRLVEMNYVPQAKEKGLELRIVRTRVCVASDPVILERIISNLVSNAIRYTARGRILLGCRRHQATVAIQVWDTGIGIPQEHQQHIFEEFFQLGNPERDHSRGLGLGLSIVERSAALLGCALHMQSEPGRGSCFSVDVPRLATRSAAASVPALRTLAPRVAGAFVVVIDDEAGTRFALEALFKQWGCHVVSAECADEACAKLREHLRSPDVIISDYRLRNNLTGIMAIRDIRAAAEEDIPAIIVTGDVSAQELTKLSESGVAVLHKPVSADELRRLVGSLLKRGNDAR
jgi:signal transduction histidine kinase/CheY-like chemotaxis protein